MIIQVIIRLTLYIDQAIIRNGQELAGSSIFGIGNTVNNNFSEFFLILTSILVFLTGKCTYVQRIFHFLEAHLDKNITKVFLISFHLDTACSQ